MEVAPKLASQKKEGEKASDIHTSYLRVISIAGEECEGNSREKNMKIISQFCFGGLRRRCKRSGEGRGLLLLWTETPA